MKFKLSQEMRINGVTPLDNLFISEFMLGAPGDFVKVYIYLLMQCTMDMDCDEASLARDLAMDDEKIQNAINYWVRKGLLKKSGGGYSFASPKTVVSCNAVSKTDTLNTYKSFNAALQELMPGRNINPDNFSVAYDWIEVYGLSSDCVLIMVDYAVNKKYKSGKKISFNTLNKMALDWAEKNIKTAKKAKEYVAAQTIINSDARAILNQLGTYRNPTVDEYNLLEKWEKEYGFDLNALIACCSQMVYSKSPSFALLDTIVTGYYNDGIKSAEEITSAKINDDKMFNIYKEIIQRCGGFGSATKAQKELLDSLFEKGFNNQGLLYICDYLAEQDKKGLGGVVKLAEELFSKDITEENAVCEELEERKLVKGKVKEFLEAAGFSRNPTASDISSYQSYASALGGHEIMLKAAGFAASAKNKSEHLTALLENWRKSGVKDINAAQDIAPVVKKKDEEKKQYLKNEKHYSDEDLFA